MTVFPMPRVDWGSQRESRRMADLSTGAPRVPWDQFVNIFRWEAGEHVALIGPTGQGKTTLLLTLLPLRPFVVVFATKPKDDSMTRLVQSGYTKMSRWRSLDPRNSPRRVLWPDASRIDSVTTQKEVFRDAFAAIYREGGWTVALDEVRFITDNLGLSNEVRLFLLQGRSLGISLVSATQRPRFVPLEVYDQSTHLFFWRDNDKGNLERLSEINVRSAALIRTVVANLEQFQVLYVNTRTGQLARTRAPALAAKRG